MKRGGDKVDGAVRIIRYAGLVFPLLLVAYGFVFLSSLGDSQIADRLGWLIVISAVWVTIAIWQFLWRSQAKGMSLAGIILYHLLAAGYVLVVTDLGLPFLVCWLFLLLASSYYLGGLGTIINTVAFVTIIYLGSSVHGFEVSPTYNLSVLLAVLVTGFFLIGLSKSQEDNQAELKRSHAQAELERSRVLTIINNLADAVITTDEYDTVQIYNAACLNLLDTNDDLTNRSVDSILPLIDADDKRVLPTTLLKNSRRVKVHDDLWYVFEDGERMRLEITLSPIRSAFHRKTSSDQKGYIIILRDVTKAKDLEEERDEFISVVSHELRTPITAVEGSLSNVQLMLNKGTIAKERINEALELAHGQSIYLARMVNDLSTLSRAERGVSDDTEIIDVKSMVNSLYRTYLPDAEAKKLEFNLDAENKLLYVDVSRLYIEELLQNFITNAIRYTKEGSVTLKVRRKGDVTSFSVEDTGIGISKPDQEKIFKKFYRSEDYRTRETGGTGLGLYVAAKLSRKLDTQIKLTSRLNHGSNFGFDLPTVKSSEPDESAPKLDAPNVELVVPSK